MEKEHDRWPRPGLRDVTGGLIGGAVALAYAFSYAALLFPWQYPGLLSLALGLALVNAAVGALWLALRSQLPFAVAGPDGNTTSILAGMTAAVAGSVSTAVQGPNLLALVMATTVLCGVLFLVLGTARLGSAVRFIPYPVIGGFLASTGWLIATGGLRVVTDFPVPGVWMLWLSTRVRDPLVMTTIALGLLYVVILRRWRHPAVMPGVLVGTAAVLILALKLLAIPVENARADGWLFDAGVAATWSPPWAQDWSALQWQPLLVQWVDMLAVVAVAVITLLLSSSGLEVMARRDISFDRELREHGWLNLAIAACGGYLSIVSVGRSAVLLESGVTSRLAGVISGLVCLAAIWLSPWLLGWLPRPVLAGFLLYIGMLLLHEWVIVARSRLTRSDWLLVIVILGTTAMVGFTVAVLAGILASCLNFALSYSRLGVVQHDLDGTGIRSSVQRPARHRDMLSRHGAAIRVIVLRGVIFFGTASTVLDRVRGFLQAPAGPIERDLVLDFSHVDSADSSAALTFTKIAQLAAANQVRLVVCGLGRGTEAAFAQAGPGVVIRASLDLALDEAEEGLLLSQGLDPQVSEESLAGWLSRELGGEQHWTALEPYLERRQLRSGETLMTQGDPSDDGLYLIEHGRLAVRLPHQGRGQRLASLMGGTLVGEMALYDRAPRSANVVAERKSVVWGLSRAGMERLHATAPETAIQVHAFIMRTMAERLRLANSAIAALQRGA
ncbi:SulP family inorganic anion transporter [Ramlibacter sp.]|uniref:SulP family inorganic anion transporter n=1 Tax=Ramlibacter sp. TaxID=1917967 RepID=UPI0035AF1DDC